MNIKKILMVSLFLLILASVTMGLSYSASSEKIGISSTKMTEKIEKKIVSIDRINFWSKKSGDKYYYKIKIKKNYQNKYRIQSVKCEYIDYGYDSGNFYKTVNGKNKKSLNIKPLNNDYIMSMTVKFQTKEKIKSESTKFWEKRYKILRDKEFRGKKANIKVREKGYWLVDGQGNTFIKYQKVDIKTTSKKYKIKTIKALYYEMADFVSKTKTFKGNGKTTFTKVIKENFDDRGSFLDKFKITYY